MTSLLEDRTNHVVCAKDEPYAIGVAESVVGILRITAKSMLLQANIPKQFWSFSVSHTSYLTNIVYPAQNNKFITIFESLFHKKADASRILPFGSFTCIYADRRSMQDQSLDLTSTQRVFISIARHNKELGYCNTDGHKIHGTRDSLAFDPHFFPFVLRPNAATSWQFFIT